MKDCIFCKIIAGEIPSSKVYEDECVYAFNDIEPQAPTHILIIPKKHFDNVLMVDEKTQGKINNAIREIAKEKGIKSFRLVTNTGDEAGQSVKHLHYHLLAGRNLQWPPG